MDLYQIWYINAKRSTLIAVQLRQTFFKNYFCQSPNYALRRVNVSLKREVNLFYLVCIFFLFLFIYLNFFLFLFFYFNFSTSH